MSIIVYHGTTIENYQKIVEEGFKVKTPKGQFPNDLGSGIYTFCADEGNIWRPGLNAWNFANQYKDGEPVVLALHLKDLQSFRILDLDLNSSRSFWEHMRSQFEVKANNKWKSFKPGKAKKRHNLDGIIMNYALNEFFFKQPDIILKDTYTSFIPHTMSNFPNGKELVILNPRVIKYFYPLGRENFL